MMTDKPQPGRHTNRLIGETSPYLLQHAHNPVDWYPWGEEALEKARRESKLILLSIGYSACHWCHVMERESFEDDAIAALMNANFVNIKVDREERPDLDEIYMAATVAMNRGQGGWPMTVFLTPDLEPVFAGTYFPPHDMYGRPGFPSVLQQVSRAWTENREGLKERAAEFVEHLRAQQSLEPALAVGVAELRGALKAYSREFDAQYGGFGSAPKFPPSVGLQLLLRLHRRFGDAQALEMVTRTLQKMAQGGMYDHIGGGFCRYSTDRQWLVPHFEKMLYDNALLTKAYLEGYQVTGNDEFRRVAVETLDYILREMASREGGIYSSTDADSEGVEGKFFVWTPEQIEQVLGKEDARRFNAYYDITRGGNWEGKSIPNTPHSIAAVASHLGIGADELRRTLTEARRQAYTAREERVKPGLDDKILTAWNGLMIGALAEGYRVLRDPRYVEAAERAADFLLQTLSRKDGRLLRTYRAGVAHLDAYLEDYAYLAEGLIDLYEACGTARWLREAERLLERTIAEFLDEDTGCFFNTARDHEKLIMRYRDGADGATPSANAVTASALARISYHLDRPELRQAAVRAVRAFGPMITRFPRGFAKSLCVVDLLLEGPVELAFVGRRGSNDLEALQSEAARHYLPNRIQAILDPDESRGADLPLLSGKNLVRGRAALYVCRDFTCKAPVTEPGAVAAALKAEATRDERRTTIGARFTGRATAEGTARYAARFDSRGYVALGRSGLTTSRLGFGGYRTSDRSTEHRAALTQALGSGVNLIDTSTNYMDGGSERMVGGTMRELIEGGALERTEVIVVSKIGYVQGVNFELARARESEGKPYPEMLKLGEDLWHCIHPEFLADQLQLSRDRLELETLDICLLHNPEYFLADAARRGQPVEAARTEFYRRLREAFAYFESQVAAGRITGYGVSSNTAVAPSGDPEATSADLMLAAAREAGGDDHHFMVLQFPLNLLEPGAVFERNGEGDRTVLESAQAASLAVLVNRPLNAFFGGMLVRLADVSPEEGPVVDLDAQLNRVAELEIGFQLEIAPKLEIAPGALDPSEYFRMAERIREMRSVLTDVAHWSQIESQIRFAAGSVIAALDRQLEGPLVERWSEWRDDYVDELEKLIRSMRRQAAERSQERTRTIASAIDPLLPAQRRREPLSRKALGTLVSTPGVTCVLVGMRSALYVADAVEVLDWPKLDSPEELYRAAVNALGG